jgi:hypothetical protein
VNAWFGNPPLRVLRPRTENHPLPYGLIPPPLFSAQVQAILSCILEHSGRIVCALAMVGKISNKPNIAFWTLVISIGVCPSAVDDFAKKK